MPSANCKEILIAPLDWGMGHTTRCVPIIAYMQRQGHHITFAGNEWQRAFINNTFGAIDTIHLDGYDVRYSNSGKGFVFSIISQVPGLLKTIGKEHEWLLELTRRKKFDAIISDNRYGIWHPSIPSVIMTHQLQVITGMGAIADKMFKTQHYKLLNRFKECWVVDSKKSTNLSGKLAHPKQLPKNTKYIGFLSQFYNAQSVASSNPQPYLLVLLSGPEPQRTILSKLLWQQLEKYNGKIIFVEGSNSAETPSNIPSNITYYKQLTKETLLPILESAAMVICRSGYSSLMDLVALHKKAVIIPTPGQTEQEYLASYLQEQGIFYATEQKEFNLEATLNKAAHFPFKQMDVTAEFSEFTNAIDYLLQ